MCTCLGCILREQESAKLEKIDRRLQKILAEKATAYEKIFELRDLHRTIYPTKQLARQNPPSVFDFKGSKVETYRDQYPNKWWRPTSDTVQDK